MQLKPEQVEQEIRVDAKHELLELLKIYGVTNPKVILAFAPNQEADADAYPWKVHVFYNSPSDLIQVNLNVPTVLRGTKVRPDGDEVIKTIYPGEGYVGYCTKIGGVQMWVT